MMIRVNKNTGKKSQNVKYAALSTGTVDHVWYDDETGTSSPKRQNRIILSTKKGDSAPVKPTYDA